MDEEHYPSKFQKRRHQNIQNIQQRSLQGPMKFDKLSGKNKNSHIQDQLQKEAYIKQQEDHDDRPDRKSTKIDIKKLIQMKEMRQSKQPKPQPPPKPKAVPGIQKYFQKNESGNIDKCLLCGFVVFVKSQKQKQKLKVKHMKSQHPQSDINGKFIPQSQQNTSVGDYNQIAKELVKFVNDEANKQAMEFVLGQQARQQFRPYVRYFGVKKQLQKWARIVQHVYDLKQ